MGNLESTVKSPDLGAGDGVRENSEAVVISNNSDISASSGKENSGSLNKGMRDVGVSKGMRLPQGQAPTEETFCVKRARREVGVLDDPIFRSKHADIFICQRCGNEDNAEMLVKLGAIKCSSCRFIVWFPPRYRVYKDETGRTRMNRFVNVYPKGYAEEIGLLKERWQTGSCFLSFPYGEDDLMDFEVTIIPEAGLYKRVKVVFSVDVRPWYPNESPEIFHPLIDLEGNVGIGFLGARWSGREHSLDTLVAVLKHILTVKRNVLWGPVVILNHEADAMWKANRKSSFRKVRETLGGGFVGETYYPRCLIDK